MTAAELKAWREGHSLTQQEAADLLGCSRFTYLRWENSTGELASSIAERIIAAEKLMAQDPSAGKKPRFQRQHWTLQGHPIDENYIAAQPDEFYFYRTDSPKNTDERTHDLLANLYVKTRAAPKGQCTYFQLNTVTWMVRCVAWSDHPKHMEYLPKLNDLLAAKRGSIGGI
jgi:DNA-binding XRE family transcriptional regulator